MHLYFHTNTEMMLYYIKVLLRDGDEHPMSEIYDYMMRNYKDHTITGELVHTTVIPSALWRLANTDGSGYYRLQGGVYQTGDSRKTMKGTPSLYERAIRVVSRTEREPAGSFYANPDQGMDSKTSTEVQKAGREVLDKLGQIRAGLIVMQQRFTKEMGHGQDQASGMSMELQEMEDVYLPGIFEGKDRYVAVAVSGFDHDWGGGFVLCACGGSDRGDYPDADHGFLCLFNHPL